MVELQDFAEIIMGQSPEGTNYNDCGEGLPLVTGAGQFGYRFPRPTQYSRTGLKVSAVGDIIIGVRASIGDINWSDREYYLGRGVAALRPRETAFGPFLWRFLETQHEYLNSRATGSTFKQIKKDDLAQLLVPLPPLDEQRRIAAILDRADDLRHKRRLAIDKLNELPQAIFHAMFGPARTQVEGFPVHPLSDVISVRSGNALTQSQLVAGPFPVYGGNGINGYHSDFMVPAGTVVIGRVGVYCGAVHVTTSSAWVTDNALIVSTENGAVLPTYLSAALINADLNQYAGRSAQPLISGGRLYPIKIPVPPLPEQERFSLSAAAAGATLETSMKQLHCIDKLFLSLQYRAFNGEL